MNSNRTNGGPIKHLDFILLDMCALIFAFVCAYTFKFHSPAFWNFAEWKSLIVMCCLLNFAITFFAGTFGGIMRRFGSEELLNTAVHAAYNFIICCICLYVLKIGATYSRTVIILLYVFYFILSLTAREVWKMLLRRGTFKSIANSKKSIFVVGDRDNISELLSSVDSGFYNEYIIKGVCIADGEPGETAIAKINIIGNRGQVEEKSVEYTNTCDVDHIVEYVLAEHIDEVFVGVKPSSLSSSTYQQLTENGKGIHLNIRPMIGFDTDNQTVSTVGTFKALSVGVYSFSGKQLVYLMIKRLLDIIFGLLGLIALLPLMLGVKISYLSAGDKASIFYTQTRVGVDGKTFKMYKFRTMVYNADEILKEMLKEETYRKEWEKNQKFEKDPRITKMGNILRKTSLDEIPQFINILKGDMTLIGPRPLVEGELEAHNGLQLYNMVKPGITGWWGCNGRSNTTYAERLELEYYYVKNCSLYLDALCVVKTIAAILRRDGAV